jgi:hypothetical protein
LLQPAAGKLLFLAAAPRGDKSVFACLQWRFV